jgi:hypothetical protein
VDAKRQDRFRWAFCQIQALECCYDPQSLCSTLDNLPDTLDETYARILESIPQNNKQDATTILRLLTWSERPLRLEEVVDAIAVQPDARPSFDPKNRMPEPRDILRICSSLVMLVQRPLVGHVDGLTDVDGDENGGERIVKELRLAHFSVKEYLISGRIAPSFSSSLADRTARASIATLCLAYLTDLDHTLPLDELRAQFSFSQYCAEYWMVHAKAADEVDEGLQTMILEFLHEGEDAYLTCYDLYDPELPRFNSDRRMATDRPPLYYVSLAGLSEIVGPLLDRGADVNAKGGLQDNALQVAPHGGHGKIVQMLLDRGADVNTQGGHYGSALQAASAGGHDKVVQMLLDRGARVNTQGGAYDNALQAASVESHDKIVQMLLDGGADINARDRFNRSALQVFSAGGHDKIVQMLLDRGANVNTQGGYYGSALQAARYC